MNNNHLSNTDIQECATDNTQVHNRVTQHLQSCILCREKVQLYRQLFAQIKAQPSPSFDFDLSQKVLSKIQSERKFSWTNFWIGLFAIAGIAIIFVVFYTMRVLVSNLFQGSSSYLLYLLVVTILAVALFQYSEMYRKYRRNMNTLKYY